MQIRQRGPKIINQIVVTCMLFSAGTVFLQAATTTTWNPAANPAGSGRWTDKANWSGTIPDGGPQGDYKCVFNVNGARECLIDTVITVSQVVQGDNGPGGMVRIVNGGNLTAGRIPSGGTNWTGVGYNRNATMIIEAGGVLTCPDHLWVGLIAPAVGTLIIEGGTVNVQGMFGAGWNSTGIGYVKVSAGLLNLNGWHDSQSIGIGSNMDIEQGTVQISGDRTTSILAMIADKKITAYGGKGKVVYDYNIITPGKTTLTALPPVTGDLNQDFGVDLADLAILADSWLNENNTGIANLDMLCRVDLGDFNILAGNWLGGMVTDWHIAQTEFPTDDGIVTPFYANHWGIVGDGQTDVTEAIQNAMVALSNLGGGTLFLPSGRYKVCGNLTIPSRVILRGDWQIPDPAGPVTGTILMAYAGRGQNDDEGAPFIGLSNCAGVKGLTIWYPEQTAEHIQPYPPAIRRLDGSNHTVENVTFVNAYIGFSSYENRHITASPFLRHIYGTPLKTGIELDCLADVGRIETVHFSPDYWKHSGLPNAPTDNRHAQWLYGNATGIVLGRIDWSYAAYVTVEGYCQGLLLHPSRNQDDSGTMPNGQCYAFDLKHCRTGVYVEGIASVGFMFTRFNIDQVQTGLHFATAANGQALLHTCQINALNYALYNMGSAKIQAINCSFREGEIRADGGYLSIINSDLTDAAGSHITVNADVRGVTLQGNRFSRPAQITDNTAYPVLVDPAPVTVTPLPAYDFKKPTQAHTAAKPVLYVVTEPPYNAPADLSSDATPAFQAALNDAGANGGGIVFVPGGDYRLDGTLMVPTGVELRGIHDLAFSPSARGSVLNTYYGKYDENGTPFIQIQPHAGIRGLTIHHAGQIYDFADPVNYGMTPYPYMIRGLGEEVYVISIAATIPWQLLDLATYPCDRHYVDCVLGTALKTGVHVGGGSKDGRIQNCQFNPSAYVFQRSLYPSIPSTGDMGGVYQIAWRQAIPYLIGHVSGQVLHQNFVFGGWRGANLVNENGHGPSGYCLGLGIDQCTTSICVDDIGDDGLDMINSQIVTVDYTHGSYLETNLPADDTFRMFATCCWGGSEKGIRIHRGHVELQLCQIDSWGWVVDTTYTIGSGGNLRTIGSNMTQDVDTLIQLDPNGTIEVIANMIKIANSGMPIDNGSNLKSRGNLRIR